MVKAKSFYIYESGGRDIENPFSGNALEQLIQDTEGSWEIDVRNLSNRYDGGYPKEEKDSEDLKYRKDVILYPFSPSQKGSPRGNGYPTERDWWQKALSFFKKVTSRYNVVNK